MKIKEDDMSIAESERVILEESLYEYVGDIGNGIKSAINAFNRLADGGGY